MTCGVWWACGCCCWVAVLLGWLTGCAAALSVKFQEQDVTTADFPPASFDVIYSRDTLLHIADKPALFVKFFEWLRPGGRILISDYCRGERTCWDSTRCLTMKFGARRWSR